MVLTGFEQYSRDLADAVRRHPELTGLALMGSTSDAGRRRRDEWSDHDFFAIVDEGRGAAVRPDISWLPDPERIVLSAREGEIGFAVVYDDGRVCEFALAELGELRGAVAGDATIVVDDDVAAPLEKLVTAAQVRARAEEEFDPVEDLSLVFIKLLIGVGRTRRGEAISGGEFIRVWAIRHFVRAVRGRFDSPTRHSRDSIDATRRFERDHPAIARRLLEITAGPNEIAAHALFGLTRDLFEPGWAAFPSAGADAVAARLGWDR